MSARTWWGLTLMNACMLVLRVLLLTPEQVGSNLHAWLRFLGAAT